MKTLSWKPQRRGNIYCSSACGHGCTREAYQLAWKRAKALAARLGGGWKPVVWENLGWHYKVIDTTGCVKVHGCGEGRNAYYSAYLGSPDSAGGQWASTENTPEKALRSLCKEAKKAIDKYRAIITAFEAIPFQSYSINAKKR